MPEKKPTRTADLDYFYGQSSELFSFYRIPKLLFQDSRFQPLSTDAKTLYGILGHTNASFTLDTYTHVTSDMQKQACGIVGGFMEDIFGKELKPWQENEKPATEP